jgi:hypothetical protein
MALDLNPQLAPPHVLLQCELKRLGGLPYGLIVQIDALNRVLLAGAPVASGEAIRSTARNRAKAGVVMQERFDHLLRAAHRVQRGLERRSDFPARAPRFGPAWLAQGYSGLRFLDEHNR